MPPDPPTEAATRLLPPLAAWLLEPPPIQNPGYATAAYNTLLSYSSYVCSAHLYTCIYIAAMYSIIMHNLNNHVLLYIHIDYYCFTAVYMKNDYKKGKWGGIKLLHGDTRILLKVC